MKIIKIDGERRMYPMQTDVLMSKYQYAVRAGR